MNDVEFAEAGARTALEQQLQSDYLLTMPIVIAVTSLQDTKVQTTAASVDDLRRWIDEMVQADFHMLTEVMPETFANLGRALRNRGYEVHASKDAVKKGHRANIIVASPRIRARLGILTNDEVTYPLAGENGKFYAPRMTHHAGSFYCFHLPGGSNYTRDRAVRAYDLAGTCSRTPGSFIMAGDANLYQIPITAPKGSAPPKGVRWLDGALHNQRVSLIRAGDKQRTKNNTIGEYAFMTRGYDILWSTTCRHSYRATGTDWKAFRDNVTDHNTTGIIIATHETVAPPTPAPAAAAAAGTPRGGGAAPAPGASPAPGAAPANEAQVAANHARRAASEAQAEAIRALAAEERTATEQAAAEQAATVQVAAPQAAAAVPQALRAANKAQEAAIRALAAANQAQEAAIRALAAANQAQEAANRALAAANEAQAAS